MKSKWLTQSATRVGKARLKAVSMEKARALKLAANHNETLVREA